MAKVYPSGKSLWEAIEDNDIDLDRVKATLKSKRLMGNERVIEAIFIGLPYSFKVQVLDDLIGHYKLRDHVYKAINCSTNDSDVEKVFVAVLNDIIDNNKNCGEIERCFNTPYFTKYFDLIEKICEGKTFQDYDLKKADNKDFQRKHFRKYNLTQDFIDYLELPYNTVLEESKNNNTYFDCGLKVEDIHFHDNYDRLLNWFVDGNGWDKLKVDCPHSEKIFNSLMRNPDFLIEQVIKYRGKGVPPLEYIEKVLDKCSDFDYLKVCLNYSELYLNNKEFCLNLLSRYQNYYDSQHEYFRQHKLYIQDLDTVIASLTNSEFETYIRVFDDSEILKQAVKRNKPSFLGSLKVSHLFFTLKEIIKLPIVFQRYFATHFINNHINEFGFFDYQDDVVKFLGRAEIITAVPHILDKTVREQLDNLKEKLIVDYNTADKMVFKTVSLDSNGVPTEKHLCYSCLGYNQTEKGVRFISVNQDLEAECCECGGGKINIETNGELPELAFPKAS